MSQFEARMQEASRQLFEMVNDEYAEEEEERISEGLPPSPQSKSLPVRLHSSFVCNCHLVDWMSPLKNGGNTIYKYIDGTDYEQGNPPPGKEQELMCGDKVNLGQITVEQAATQCSYYSWDNPNTKLPKDFIDFMRKWDRDEPYDSRLDIRHPDHYLNHYRSLQELFDHLQDPVVAARFPFPPIQGTTDVFQAQADINEVEELKRDSL